MLHLPKLPKTFDTNARGNCRVTPVVEARGGGGRMNCIARKIVRSVPLFLTCSLGATYPAFSLSWVVLLLAVLLSCCGPSLAYPSGPPTKACEDMFPFGHHADAHTTTPPYELVVSSTNLTANTQYNVTVRVKSGQSTFFKGMFVQARLADNCDNVSPLGHFNISSNDSFLQLMQCSAANDAVSQKNDTVQTNKNFTWTSPSVIPGTVYFRATVVFSEKMFWTDVFSGFLLPSGAKLNPQYCLMQKTMHPSTTSFEGTSDASIVAPARVLTAVVCVVALVARI